MGERIMNMNPEIKALWIDALNSGEYTQGRGYLQKNGDFCCLGVLCDLAEKEGVITHHTEDFGFDGTSTTVAIYGPDYASSSTMLPETVAEWAGFEGNTMGRFEGRVDGINTLWELNDSSHYSFRQIAKVISEKF
jgi:hypothetical protein